MHGFFLCALGAVIAEEDFVQKGLFRGTIQQMPEQVREDCKMNQSMIPFRKF